MSSDDEFGKSMGENVESTQVSAIQPSHVPQHDGIPLDQETATVLGAETDSDATLGHGGSELRAGTTLGKYVIRMKLGAGGMGAVYLAFDPVIEREVAVKVLPPEIASRPQALNRFLTEAKATGKLNHPHVVAIYDIAEHNGLNYIVMEVLRGGSVQQLSHKVGALPWQDACAVVADAADGLAAAHAAGLVHRDIKPENLMLTEDRIVKIVDFGLAKLLDAAGDTQEAVTRMGQVMGTPQFMSPEQFGGSAVDHRSDIYSLGGTLFQLLTGRFPFDDCPTIVQLMYAHLERPIADPRDVIQDVPAGCRDVIAKAMAKAAGDRYQDAGEMARDLRAILYGRSLEASDAESAAMAEDWRALESVCLVEPSRMQARMLSDSLKQSGVTSIRVHDRAQDAISDASPAADVVITAMHLPDMSGLDLFRKLREDRRYRRSMLVLNSSDVTVGDLIDAGSSHTLALVSKGTKPLEILRSVHACSFLSVASASFDTPLDPVALRMLMITDGEQIPAPLADLIRKVGLLDIEICSLADLGSEKRVRGRFHLAVLLRTAGDAGGDTSLYANLLTRVQDAAAIEATAIASVQVDGNRMTLRALSQSGFTAVTRCPLDECRFRRVLQAAS